MKIEKKIERTGRSPKVLLPLARLLGVGPVEWSWQRITRGPRINYQQTDLPYLLYHAPEDMRRACQHWLDSFLEAPPRWSIELAHLVDPLLESHEAADIGRYLLLQFRGLGSRQVPPFRIEFSAALHSHTTTSVYPAAPSRDRLRSQIPAGFPGCRSSGPSITSARTPAAVERAAGCLLLQVRRITGAEGLRRALGIPC